MLRAVEATIDENGKVHPTEPVKVARRSRALLTILGAPVVEEVTLLSEAALQEWNSAEEDAAWEYLRSGAVVAIPRGISGIEGGSRR